MTSKAQRTEVINVTFSSTLDDRNDVIGVPQLQSSKRKGETWLLGFEKNETSMKEILRLCPGNHFKKKEKKKKKKPDLKLR